MTATTSSVPFLKKISAKTITEAVHLDLMKLGETRPVAARTLFDLFGQVVGVKTGMTDKGAWTKFTGRFQAVTPDGEVFDSSAAHVPVLEDLLHNSLLEAQAKDPRARIEIALRIGIKPAPTGKPSATGYEYVVERLIPETTGADDPIARLRAQATAPAAIEHKPDASPADASSPAAKPAGAKGK